MATDVVYLIEWYDAAAKESWQERSVAAESTLLRCFTTGILISQDKRCAVVAQNWCYENDQVSDVSTIPTASIIKRTRIARVKRS